MKKILLICLSVLLTTNFAMAQKKVIDLRILETSDVHGSFFPYNFISRKPVKGSLASVATYVKELRKQHGDNVILLENGDILQGQPTNYYYNFEHPEKENIAAQVVNFIGYDAQSVGNHDVETGHAVYDKWIKELDCPTVGANIVDTATGKPYVKPYVIIERDGVKVAVLGMITPAIPNWLNESLWSGLRFEEMVSCARYWVEYIKEHEGAHVIAGLFHSGRDGGIKTDKYMEDASLKVAEEVDGFDVIFYGHDHFQHNEIIKNKHTGKEVLCIDPSCNAHLLSDVSITVTMEDGKMTDKKISGMLADMDAVPADPEYMSHFEGVIDEMKAYVSRQIGEFKAPMHSRDCFFGTSSFTDFIHDVQLQLTDADISFNAPLMFNTTIEAGPIYVSDMFKLYKYENMVYILELTGEEVRKHLELSYDLWVNTMKSKDDHIMKLDNSYMGDKQRYGFKNLTFNFDSAAGIDYEVDVTKPDGEKVRILRMSDGRPFDEKKTYRVAMNSYRGNGGGELLTRGAGIPLEKVKERIVYQSERDQRYYLMKEIEKQKVMTPKAHDNWKFVPAEWTEDAIKRDKELIFGKK